MCSFESLLLLLKFYWSSRPKEECYIMMDTDYKIRKKENWEKQMENPFTSLH